jgi:hypothetical protein
VTSQKEIQTLIADIDSVLPKADARLPWSKPGDVAAQRRVLERVRSYLVSQQENVVAAPEKPHVPAPPGQGEVVQQVVYAVTQEINFLRADLLQPLQADLEALRNERESLVREIRQLELTRAQFDSLPQRNSYDQQVILEFSQQLISRCAESLTQQLAQIVANLLSAEVTTGAIAKANSAHIQVGGVLHPQERLEQLRQLQAQSDEMLITLDANQRAIFEALQRNLQSYQESLSQGLEKMHSLSVQGEMLFTALVNRLAEQLGQEALTIFSSSGQLSDSATNTTEAPTRQTTPATLLPTDTLSVTSPSPPPNALGGTQMPLQPVEPPVIAPESTTTGVGTQGTTANQSTPEDSFLENLNSENWEIIEGLDSESLSDELDDSDEIDTFIQLDINPQASLPLVEEDTPSRRESQDIDSLAGQTKAGEVAGLNELNEAAELNLSSQSDRQEINDLYESLFGTNSLTGTREPDKSDFPVDAESDAEKPQLLDTDSQIPRDDQLIPADSVNPLSSEVEELLFEGFADPATEATQEQLLVGGTEQSPQSWADLLFDDSATHSPVEIDLAGEAQASSLAANSLSNRESALGQEGIKTISALTDLFEEMGLPPSPPVAVTDSVPAITIQPPEYQTSDTDSQASLLEENYTPASPEEYLLPTNELEGDPEVEIWLEQSSLQQLQQDLYRFEEVESQNLSRQEEQRLPGNYVESPTAAPDASQVNQPNQQFLMPEELLAEDWEEFVYNDLAAPESVESDFDPDLFPSEALEIDSDFLSEETLNSDPQEVIVPNAAAPEELGRLEWLIATEEETISEDVWHDFSDSNQDTTLPPEAWEDDSNFFSQEMLDSEPEDAVTGSDAAVEELRAQAKPEILRLIRRADRVSEQVEEASSDSIQDTALLPEALDNEADAFPEAARDSEQQETISSEGKALSEDERKDNLPQEVQMSNESNFDINLPQPDALNPDQLDIDKEKTSNRDSDFNG